MPLEKMLRVYCQQNCHALIDTMAEETLYESEANRLVAGIELGDAVFLKRPRP